MRPNQGSSELMKTCAEEIFGQEGICLHESTSVLFTIRFVDNHGRPDMNSRTVSPGGRSPW